MTCPLCSKKFSLYVTGYDKVIKHVERCGTEKQERNVVREKRELEPELKPPRVTWLQALGEDTMRTEGMEEDGDLKLFRVDGVKDVLRRGIFNPPRPG